MEDASITHRLQSADAAGTRRAATALLLGVAGNATAILGMRAADTGNHRKKRKTSSGAGAEKKKSKPGPAGPTGPTGPTGPAASGAGVTITGSLPTQTAIPQNVLTTLSATCPSGSAIGANVAAIASGPTEACHIVSSHQQGTMKWETVVYCTAEGVSYTSSAICIA